MGVRLWQHAPALKCALTFAPGRARECAVMVPYAGFVGACLMASPNLYGRIHLHESGLPTAWAALPAWPNVRYGPFSEVTPTIGRWESTSYLKT
jgi:hypothetical protein